MVGESAGAFAALAAGASDPEDFAHDGPELPPLDKNHNDTSAGVQAVVNLWGNAELIMDEFSPGDPPVMIVHGTADLHVRYDGGKPERSMGRAGRRVDAAVADAAKYYRTRNGLTGEPETTVDGGVRIETWQADERTLPVCVVTIGGGGHAWPGGTRGNYLGADEPVAWDATVAIWGFFAQLQTPRDAGAVPTPR